MSILIHTIEQIISFIHLHVSKSNASTIGLKKQSKNDILFNKEKSGG